MTNHCPSCHHKYTRCICMTGATTKGRAAEPITARMVFRAACKMQRAGLPISTGAEHVEGRHIDTGRVNTTPYVADETAKEYQARKYRERKGRR